VNYDGLFRSAMVALLRNKMRSILTVLGITIGIAVVICVVAIGKAGQARVQQQLNNLGDNFVWIEAGGRAVNGVRTGTHDSSGVRWKDSYATLGRFDVVDVVEANDPKQIEKAAMIIRAYGHSTTETLVATPWKEFLATL